MKRILGRLYKVLANWLGLPSNDERRAWCNAWDFAQANDGAVWSLEQDEERVSAALRLRDTDPAAAFRELLALAEEGSILSMGAVGYSYWVGRGVRQDPGQAEEWCRKAYEGGSQRSLLNYVAIVLTRGDLDDTEAALIPAAADGWAPALYWLAQVRLRRSNTRETLLQVRPMLERAIEKGSRYARLTLAREMTLGHLGLGEIPTGLRMMWRYTHESRVAIEAAADAGSMDDAAGLSEGVT